MSVANVGIAFGQQSPPDIRGQYSVSGIEAIYGCNFEGQGPIMSVAFPALLTVATQDGNAFFGTISDPAAQVAYFDLTGHVSDQGLIEGTWTYDQDLGIPNPFQDSVFTGEIADHKAAVEMTARFGTDGFYCLYRVSLSASSVTLSWSPPDPASAEALPPPRALTATPGVSAQQGKADGAATDASQKANVTRAEPTGYNVYRSTTPGVQPTPDNLFTSVPPTQTSVPASDGSSGSFFVVTATYGTGESDPSNEVSGGVPAASLSSVNVKGAKIVAKGTDFSTTVQVFVDGIPFAAPAMVKKGKKVVQKGNLLTGQSLSQYITPGRTVAITIRNDNGGIATWVYPKP